MSMSMGEGGRLEALQRELDKKYGRGILMRLDGKRSDKVSVLSTRSLWLDRALGVGGLPWGRLVEVFGLESSGKTTLALQCIAEAQAQGVGVLFVDAEHALDGQYAKALGIKLANLWVCQPDYGEQALDVADRAIQSGGIKLVVVDSVSALIPQAERNGEMGTQSVGAQARLMSQAMRKLAGHVHKAGAMVLFINQIRHKVGVIFGSPEVTSGGNALKFYASVRLKVSRGALLKNVNGEVFGHEMKVKVAKNKLAAPFKEVAIPLYYGEGTSQPHELIDIALAEGILKQSGSWFSLGEQRLGQGKMSLREQLKKDPKLMQQLTKAIARQKAA